MKIIKKLLFILMVFVCISCANNYKDNNNAEALLDGKSFDYYNTYEINNNSYDIYLPSLETDYLLYLYKESNQSTMTKSWIINYRYENNYIFSQNINESSDILNDLYEILNSNKKQLQDKLNLDKIDIYPNDYYEQREEELINNTNQEITFLNVYKYLPLRIKNKSINYTFTIIIPISNIFLIKTHDKIETITKDKMIPLEDFYLLENIKKLE